ncbi:Y-family DNA polymerase [Anatilimnocola floriformis]|uniref:Y-family DNA polymerase n=1 Tax=Anatilimnocola floriformis TaxID=2948575 RepID=UPI0020C36F50|nr:DNA polymerase Y family protein [Anatilimnocola floriformis]
MRPQLKRRAVVVYEERQGRRVVASNMANIAPGVLVAEISGATLEPYDSYADRVTLEKLAEWCEQFSPIVALEEAERPERLLLDITGLPSFFGGESALAERMGRALARRGLITRFAIADTLGAAWGLTLQDIALNIAAAGDQEAVANLPVAALRLSLPTLQMFRELGLQLVGQLLMLPRESLRARFGQELLDRLSQILGTKRELITPYRAEPELAAERSLEEPLDSLSILETIVAQLVDEVAFALATRHQGALRLECRLVGERGEALLSVGLFEASGDPRHLLELLRMRLEHAVCPGPVSLVRLSVLDSAKLVYRQRELFTSNQDRPRELALLIDRLSGRLGRESVLRARLASDAQPEYAFRYEMLAGGSQRRLPAEQRTLPERPLLLEPRPIPIEVLALARTGPPVQFRFQGEQQRTQRSWGPERIQTGWWRGRYIRRDYYRVESDRGCHYWLFRSAGKWFLHGIFD